LTNKKAIFIDTGNLYYCISKKFNARRLDYAKFLETTGPYDVKHAYVAQMNDQVDRFIKYLENLDFNVHVKSPRKRKVNSQFIWEIDWKIEITLNVIDFLDACEDGQVTLATNDVGFIPLIDDLLDQKVSISIIAAGVPNVFSEKTRTIEIPESCLCE